jgi:hypothetical protein
MGSGAERLGFDLGANTEGLDQAEREAVAFLDRLEATFRRGQNLPGLSIDTAQLRAELEASGVSVDQFFASFRQGAAEGLSEIERSFQAAGETSADAVQSLGEALTAAQEQSQSLQETTAQPVGLNVSPAVSEAERLDARVNVLRHNIQVLRDEAAVPLQLPPAPPPPPGPPSGPLTLLGSQDQVAQAQNAQENAAALERMAAAQADAARQSQFLSRETRDNVRYSQLQADASRQAAAASESAGAAFEFHGSAARRATTAISQLAATSIGAEGPVARLAESALLFGGGELAVVGTAAAVLGLAAAYNFATTAERQAEEQQDRLVRGLLDEADHADPSRRAGRAGPRRRPGSGSAGAEQHPPARCRDRGWGGGLRRQPARHREPDR